MKKAFVAVFLFFGSCKSTESINRFARSAGAGIAELDQGSFGFGQYCALYGPETLGLLTDTALYKPSPAGRPACAPYKTSDSLGRIINHTLRDYFLLLQSVSDKKLIAYNARPLVSALADVQPGLLPGLSFSDEKIAAVEGLLNTLLNEPLTYYRAQKLRKVIRENDASLSLVIRAYVFMLDTALAGEIGQAAVNYRSFVYAPMYEKAVSPVEKAWVNNQYKDMLGVMEAERLKIRKSVRMLETVLKDHHLLAAEGKRRTFAEVESEIAGDILLINDLISEIIRLTR